MQENYMGRILNITNGNSSVNIMLCLSLLAERPFRLCNC